MSVQGATASAKPKRDGQDSTFPRPILKSACVYTWQSWSHQ